MHVSVWACLCVHARAQVDVIWYIFLNDSVLHTKAGSHAEPGVYYLTSLAGLLSLELLHLHWDFRQAIKATGFSQYSKDFIQ